MKILKNLVKIQRWNFGLENLKMLRARSGAPLIKCKEALEKFDDIDRAIDYLKEKNLMSAMKFS